MLQELNLPIQKASTMPVVLVVSEDKVFLNTARINFGQSGFAVITTLSTTEALELSNDKEIDVIVCDYDLSQMDGIMLFEKIKQSRGDDTPPTLIIAEQYTAPLVARCASIGTAGLHAKSDDNEALIDRVASIIVNDEKRTNIQKYGSKRVVQGGTDPLTKIASKQHFSRRLNAESVASYRESTYITVLVLSIDRYSRMLEMHGQKIAESVLAQIARIIEGELRSRDCVGRYSDHTFGIVLPETSSEAASSVGKRLRQIIASSEFGNLDHPIGITVSIGTSSRNPEIQQSPDELITQSLKNSVAAQSMGGDKVISDSGLTGKPVTLLLGGPDESTRALARDLEVCNMEVRLASTFNEAQVILKQLPVAIIAINYPLDNQESDAAFLSWAKRKFPSSKRLIAAQSLDMSLLTKLINNAEINYFLPVPWKTESIRELVDQLIYA